MKKILSLFLSLIMVMGVFFTVPVTANAADVNDLGFEFDSADGSYTVIGCDPDASGDLVIPERYNNYRVRKIDVYAFGGCDNLTSITIPNTVISIGAYAFNYCSGLKSVTIPDSVTSIGNYAFKDCSNLRSVTIPENVNYIGYDAFAGTGSIQEIYLGNDVALEYLAYSTLQSEYRNVKKVTLGNKVTYVPEYTFSDCKLLESLTLGDRVEYIGPYAFGGCVKLKSVTIPDKLTAICEDAFYKCEALESITIGNSLESIGDYAFYKCNKLSKVYIKDIAKWCSISFGYECANPLEIAKNLYINGSLANNVVIPGKVTKINDRVFYNCKSLKLIEIPESVQAIGEDAFYGCSNLNSIKAACNSCAPKYFYYYNASEFYDKMDLTHNLISDWIISRAPTCIQEGKRYKYCKYCGETMETETLSKVEHRISKYPAVEATCTNSGKTEGSYCNYCYEVLVPQTIIPAKGHTTGDWEITQEATVNSKGEKIKVCTECGEIAETATIKQLKCAKPSLKKIENTSDGVKISWGKVTGADKYYVYRKTGSGSYKKIATVKGNSKVSYTDKKASSGKKCYYYVKAVNEAGSSDASGSKSILYLADTTLKTPSSTKNGVVLKWSKVTGADGYQVWRKTGSGSYSKVATVKGNSKVTYTDKTAKKGKTYTYKIKAYKSKTYSAYSNTKKIKDKY